MIKYDKTVRGRVHSIYTGGMVDGPGIRCIVFFAGCSLRCKYCHNPDTWARERGDTMTVGEVIEEILKYESYYSFSGGGVTISGGEPMDQPIFLAEVLKACQEHGLHVAVDTSGSATMENAKKVLPHTNLLLLDIKSFNPDRYREITGQPLEKALAVLDLARELKLATWIRFVLVPGLTDSLDDIRAMADYLRPYENIEKIEVLPFHKDGEYKWRNLDLPYELYDTPTPSAEQVREAHGILDLSGNRHMAAGR